MTLCRYLPFLPQQGAENELLKCESALIVWKVIKLQILALTPYCHLESRTAIKAPCQVIGLKRTNRLCFPDLFKRNEQQITY